MQTDRRSDQKAYFSCAVSQNDPCPALVFKNGVKSANDAGTSAAVTLAVNSFTVIYDEYDMRPVNYQNIIKNMKKTKHGNNCKLLISVNSLF